MSERSEKYTRRAARNTYIGTVISIGLVLAVLGTLAWLGLNARKLSEHVRENVMVNVYVYKEQPADEVARFKKKLDAEPFTNSTELITPAEAAAQFQEDLGEDFVEFIGSNPLPYTIQLTLESEFAHPDSIEQIINAEVFQTHDEIIEEVQYQKSLLASLNEKVEEVSLYMIVAGGLLLLVAMVLINNTIRLTIHARRFVIKTMQLVGATKAFIHRPFLARGLLQGLYGALLAMLLISAIIYAISQADPILQGLVNKLEIALVFGAVILFGIFISWLATWFAVRRYLRLKSDDLY